MKTNWYKYLKILNFLFRILETKMPAYYWGLYPCKDNTINADLDNWNSYIAKNATEKISFNELKHRFESENSGRLEEFEKKYSKELSNIDSQLLIEKRSYLRENFKLEKNRQNTIDNKFTQIIGQSSIVIAIVAIIIPIIIDKMNFETKQIWLLIILALFSGLTILLLTTSIWISIKNLKTTGYYRPMHNHILYYSNSELVNFQKGELVTLYNAISENIKTNDLKAEKVNKAYTRFTKGIILFLLSSAIGTFYVCLNPKEDVKMVTIENQLDLAPIKSQIDSVQNNFKILQKKNKEKSDSLHEGLVKIDRKLMYLTKKIVHLTDSTKIEDGSN
jgi:hypothetical protein